MEHLLDVVSGRNAGSLKALRLLVVDDSSVSSQETELYVRQRSPGNDPNSFSARTQTASVAKTTVSRTTAKWLAEGAWDAKTCPITRLENNVPLIVTY